ncbi:ubiquitin carboxyl-terminal hydrolase 1-like [Teratosphaeria destructans]|uniref:ubiquitinyl hydrolase 1 n=1 Tax=Teratosphaeria destructans TaxID=418781 RepID=A0A9W7SU84_9PEZI|nr:ubiquitin carboxyl-terminal hydrolase 1-like [Teratosphaeria destructans]
MADRWQLPYADLRPDPDTPSPSAIVFYCLLGLCAVHQALQYFDYPILSPPELVWNALVFLTPARLILDSTKRRELREQNMLSQTHAAKSEALRRVTGLGGGSLTHKLTSGEGILRGVGTKTSSLVNEVTSDAPPGLGNWDNSCYQNSVLQGLASLGSLRTYLGKTVLEQEGTTASSLQETIAKLNDARNNGKHLWTPAKLKSMSSWQQQDAQEYFSKIMDELDKEAAKAAQAKRKTQGLEAIVKDTEESMTPLHNPVEGLLAQKVACTRCGYSEGLSMIPFNCLTVPLGSAMDYDIRECLDEYTKLEEITDVECSKCTLLRYEAQCKQMLPAESKIDQDATTESEIRQALSLPPEVRTQVVQRLRAIQQALDEDDFTDKTLNESCQIPKKGRISSTKTRQAVIGRAPQSLVVHVNRSVFDEMTGVQRKNYASVRYPMMLNLGDWIMSEQPEAAGSPPLLDEANQSGPWYKLKAVVQHYGRHENGHYICYRQHAKKMKPESGDDAQGQQWWRLSDEDVSAVSEDEVIGPHGVFMLFYERDEEELPTNAVAALAPAQAQAIKITTGGPSARSETLSIPTDGLTSVDESAKGKPEPALAPLQQPSPPPTPDSTVSLSSQKLPQSQASDTLETQRPSAQPVAEDKSSATPPLTMRRARGRKVSNPRKDSIGKGKKGFGETFRPMAAT